jgi:hypothetical protein
MANTVYPKFKEAALSTGGNLLTGTLKAMLVDTGSYTYNAAHQFLSSVAAGARVGTAVTMANKSVASGVFSADNLAFSGLVSAPTIEAIVLYLDTGNEATSQLVAYIDTATGLPTASGQTSVTVTWDTGANKIFRL